MKKVLVFNVARLRVEEAFGFFKMVLSLIEKLPDGEDIPAALTAVVSTLRTEYNSFDKVLKTPVADKKVALALAADQARDDAWRDANNYLTFMCNHYDAEKAAKAQEFKAVFEKYGDPTRLPQTEESGILHNLLADLNEFALDEFQLIELDPWTDRLAEKEEEFLAAAEARSQSQGARQQRVGIIADARKATENAYRELVETVNACIRLYGEADYESFVTAMNGLIEREKSILKARTSKGKTVKEEEDEPQQEEEKPQDEEPQEGDDKPEEGDDTKYDPILVG